MCCGFRRRPRPRRTLPAPNASEVILAHVLYDFRTQGVQGMLDIEDEDDLRWAQHTAPSSLLITDQLITDYFLRAAELVRTRHG